MKNLILIAAFALTGSVYAAETTCTVKGMHCTGCKEMVEGKLCDETKYSTCEVKVTDANKKLGSIHLVTKDASAKIDEKAVGAIISDSGYTMEKCAAGAKADKAPAKI